MNPILITKFVLGNLAGIATARAASTFFRTFVPLTSKYPIVNLGYKIGSFAAGWVVGGMFSKRVMAAVSDEVDEAIKMFNKHILPRLTK